MLPNLLLCLSPSRFLAHIWWYELAFNFAALQTGPATLIWGPDTLTVCGSPSPELQVANTLYGVPLQVGAQYRSPPSAPLSLSYSQKEKDSAAA